MTLEGTVTADLFELDRETVIPPVPAAAVRLAVPMPDRPLVMLLGLIEMLLSAGAAGLTVTPKVALAPE